MMMLMMMLTGSGLHWLAIPLGDVTFHQTLIAHLHLLHYDHDHPHLHHADLNHPLLLHDDQMRVMIKIQPVSLIYLDMEIFMSNFTASLYG